MSVTVKIEQTELVKRLSESTGMDHETVEDCFKALSDAVADGIGEGKQIQIRNFGKFSLTAMENISTINPKTGKDLFIPYRLRIHFKPFPKQITIINEGQPND